MDFVKAERHGDKIWVTADFSTKDVILTLPGSRWDRTNGVCVLNLSYASCKQLRGILGDRLEIGDALYEWAVEEVQSRVEPCLQLRQATQALNTDGMDERLYSYQKAGALFLATSGQALLSDPMGAGKSATATTAAKLLNAVPALVICPNSVKHSWKREIENWWPGMTATIVQGTKKQRIEKIRSCKDGFLIINWESTWRHSKLTTYGAMRVPPEDLEEKELNEIPWQLIIADEAHRMQDPQSKQTRAVWALGRETPYRWAMTGTPLTNTPDTLYPVLNFLSPNEWPSKTKFIGRYCNTAPSRWGPGLDVFGLNENTKDEFFEIFDPRFRRMPKEIILPFLPPVQHVRRDIEMSDEQRAGYETMVEDMIATDENGELIIAVNPISKLTRTIQYSSATLVINEEGLARMTAPSNKLTQLEADLDDYLSSGESIIVFAVHRQLIEMAEALLKKKKISYSVVKGNQKETERQRNVDDFQNKKVQVILVVIAAGGVGLTLTTGRIAIFLQRPWSNVDYRQALGRNHRIGSEQHESILVIDYVSRGTVENYQLQALSGKANQLEAVVRDRQTIERILKGEDVSNLEGE